MYVVEIDVVCEQEDDDFLRGFSHEPLRTREGRQFWAELIGSQEVGMSLHEMDDYDDVIRKLLATLTPEQRLEGIPTEKRLEGIPTEELLARIPAEQMILGLPDDALRVFPDEYTATLSEATRDAIRRRLGR